MQWIESTCSRCGSVTFVAAPGRYLLCVFCKNSVRKVEKALEEVRAINLARLKRARERQQRN